MNADSGGLSDYCPRCGIDVGDAAVTLAPPDPHRPPRPPSHHAHGVKKHHHPSPSPCPRPLLPQLQYPSPVPSYAAAAAAVYARSHVAAAAATGAQETHYPRQPGTEKSHCARDEWACRLGNAIDCASGCADENATREHAPKRHARPVPVDARRHRRQTPGRHCRLVVVGREWV